MVISHSIVSTRGFPQSVRRNFAHSTVTYVVANAAEEECIVHRSVRLYEKEGLIAPSRTSTERRIYSLNVFKIIQTAPYPIHNHGMNPGRMRSLMAFPPCWKIRGYDPVLYRTCKVPHRTDSPCWSSGKAVWRKCDGDWQSCPVYEMASQIGELSIHDLMRT